MIVERCIPVDARAEWEAALQDVPHGFAHSWGNCYAMSLTTGHVTYLYTFQADGVRIAGPIAERQYGPFTDIYTPWGFSGFVGTGAHPAFFETWTNFVVRQGYVCGYFGLHPVLDTESYCQAAELHTYNSVFVLDLTVPEERLIARLDRNRRRQLARSKATSSEASAAGLRSFFVQHYRECYRRKRASAAYAFHPRTLEVLLSLDDVLLVGAGEVKQLEAVTLFGYTASIGEALLQVSLPEGRRHSVGLLWSGARQLRALGVPLLNLGGGVKPGDGVEAFKERFGAGKRPLRCARQVYRREVYDALCSDVGVDPHAPTDYFPAYRAQAAVAPRHP